MNSMHISLTHKYCNEYLLKFVNPNTPSGLLDTHNIDHFAHHKVFDKPVMYHWYMSTPAETHTGFEPGPSDHEFTNPMHVATE